MARFLETLRAGARTRFGSWRLEDRAAVARLPVYQVALWPDGWELGRDGSVQVRDAHEMAEARRWYALAERNHSPFGTVNYNQATGKVIKCDLCGGDPACAKACPTAAITYVDADQTGYDKMHAWAAKSLAGAAATV